MTRELALKRHIYLAKNLIDRLNHKMLWEGSTALITNRLIDTVTENLENYEEELEELENN